MRRFSQSPYYRLRKNMRSPITLPPTEKRSSDLPRLLARLYAINVSRRGSFFGTEPINICECTRRLGDGSDVTAQRHAVRSLVGPPGNWTPTSACIHQQHVPGNAHWSRLPPRGPSTCRSVPGSICPPRTGRCSYR